MGQMRSKSVAKMAALRRERAQRARAAKATRYQRPHQYKKAHGWPAALVGSVVMQLILGAIALFSLLQVDAVAANWRLAFGMVSLAVVVGLLLRSRRAFDLAVGLAALELLAIYGGTLYAYARGVDDWWTSLSLANYYVLPAMTGGGDIVLSIMCPALTLFLLTRQQVRDCFGLPVWA